MKFKNVTSIFIVFFVFVCSIYSQNSSQDIFREIEKKNKKIQKPNQIKVGWNIKSHSSILLTQSSYTNWTRGGENSFAWTLNNDEQFIYYQKTIEWVNGIKTAFGHARVSSQGFRKTEDRIEFESLISKRYKRFLSPFFSIFVQTQLAPGYNYFIENSTQEEKRTEISNFWDPAYLFQSIGLRILPIQGLNLRLGFAAKEVMSRKYRQYSEDKWAIFRAGMEFVANLNKEILPQTRIKSDMRLFSSFSNFNEIQMVWDSQLILKFNKIFSANVRTLIYYEPNISTGIQLKEILGIGISYSIFEQ
jgi:hypothetical protein